MKYSSIILLLALFTAAYGQSVQKVEYFINNDPGFNHGNIVSITPGAVVVSNFSVDVTALSEGFHRLFVRARDADGNWSLTQRRHFYKANLGGGPPAAAPIVAVEYFVDNDPGFGQATALNVSAATTLDEQFVVDVTALSEGFHRLFVRARDADGNWSLTQRRHFYKANLGGGPPAAAPIIAVEYFVDNDPGFGQATALNVSAATTLDEQFVVDVTALSEGFHRLFVRARDADGNWSLTQRRHFYKAPITPPAGSAEIVKVEYFVDSDPGFGHATDIPVTRQPTIDEAFLLDITNVGFGVHTLYLRAQDTEGNWSMVAYGEFEKEEPEPLPLRYLSFTGEVREKTNVLFWDVIAQATVQHYVVERSPNGRERWTPVG